MAARKERVDRHDREVEVIRKMIMQGMRMIVADRQRSDQEHAAIRKELKELAVVQKRTEAKLERFLDSMARGNGHKKGLALE